MASEALQKPEGTKKKIEPTLFHNYSWNSEVEIYITFLTIWFQEGADINSRSDWNGTALYYAACNGHDQLIENLLEKGAEADPKDNKGCKTDFFPQIIFMVTYF